MTVNFQKTILLSAFSFVLTCCTSVEEYNKKITEPIPVEKLQADINYTQHKLEKLYPNLYGYIPKQQLNAKFDSIRSVVNQPMTSKEFYFVISPIIAAVRQGHMTMSPTIKRVSKKEAKRLKKAGDGPLSQFVFEWQNDRLFVMKSKNKKNKIKEGTEVISVNAITPQSIYKKYRKSFTSDGFNTTFLPKFFSKRYSLFLTNEIGVNDSLTYVFKQNDSLITRVVSRNKPTVKKTVTTDSVKVAKAPIDKTKIKAEKKRKRIYGYDEANKEYVKSLTVVPADSTVAVLKIKNFTQGRYYRVYDEFFDSIQKMKIKTLVIDIRDNPGGRVAEVVDLYAYLTDQDYILLQPATVTSKTSLWKSGIFRSAPKIAYPFIGIGYPIYMGFSYFRTSHKSDGSYKYTLTGTRKRKSRPNNFKGKIYVMINGGSFSASCILSASLKQNPNITFVGEETGGAFNGTVAGVMPVVELPNSQIPLRLGLMDIQTISQTKVEGRGIFPDKEIVPTIEDKINHKDLELEWILSDVKK
jgi:uncharacterized protein YcfL